MNYELSPKDLRRTFNPEELGFDTTEAVEPEPALIGQKRAVDAIRFGLGIQDDGFNIYVAGPPGIGKMTAVKSFLEELVKEQQTPWDWCYVNNFDDSFQPKVLRLPPGRGRKLHQHVKELVDLVRNEIPKAFESEEYANRREQVVSELEQKRAALLSKLNEDASARGFLLQARPYGIMIIPTKDEKPMTEDELNQMPEEARKDLNRRRNELESELKETLKRIGKLEREAQQKLMQLDRRIVLHTVGGLIDDLSDEYRDLPQVVEYLKSVRSGILEDIETFKALHDSKSGALAAGLAAVPWAKELPFRKYQVNVLVDRGDQKGAPLVVELNPSYNNLVGRIEKEAQQGALYTDFTMIKPGSLHRANGGYLVLPVDDVLQNLMSWDALKRALRAGEVHIEELSERMGFMATRSLRPEPIPLDLKVVLIGRPLLYYLLHAYDEEFAELFKVRADFDTTMECTPENTRDFIGFLCSFCCKEKCRHFEAGAVAKMLEHSCRLAEDQEKLSTHFGAMADLVRESHYWAQREGSEFVRSSHVRKALDEKIYRSSLIQERIQEMIVRGTLLIRTDGEAVGQANGLSVLKLGDYMFGKPSRITASVGPGRGGIVDIEREVELGGPIHSKGVMILSGYLAQKYSRKIPWTLSARLVFEQSYEGVEGDSASSTELYAILSALSGLPLKQGIAVTGSVNQHGEIQPIGGVNQKIEGFYDVCAARGLSGDQGVMIPRSNLKNLMLREDVVDAVQQEKFHVMAVGSIDEGIEILTGVPAGEADEEGCFPAESVNGRVSAQLQEYAQCLKEMPSEPPAHPKPRRSSMRRR